MKCATEYSVEKPRTQGSLQKKEVGNVPWSVRNPSKLQTERRNKN